MNTIDGAYNQRGSFNGLETKGNWYNQKQLKPDEIYGTHIGGRGSRECKRVGHSKGKRFGGGWDLASNEFMWMDGRQGQTRGRGEEANVISNNKRYEVESRSPPSWKNMPHKKEMNVRRETKGHGNYLEKQKIRGCGGICSPTSWRYMAHKKKWLGISRELMRGGRQSKVTGWECLHEIIISKYCRVFKNCDLN